MDWDKIMALAEAHWSFFATALILGVVGEVWKGLVLGSDNEKVANNRFTKLYKKTLAIHPIISGAILGFALSPTFTSVLYFALSGAVSGTLYSLLKSVRPEVAKALRRKVASFGGKRDSEPSPSQDDTK